MKKRQKPKQTTDQMTEDIRRVLASLNDRVEAAQSDVANLRREIFTEFKGDEQKGDSNVR